MQINNWSDLLAAKRLSKTVRDENNDLIILGTNTKGSYKKQDTWQPYAMTVADLTAAIGGGGGGVSFQLQAGNYITLQENGGLPITDPFTPAENSIITIAAISIPNGLNWRDQWSDAADDYVYNDVVYAIDPSDDTYYTYWMYNAEANPPVGAALPYTTGDENNTYWAQLGVQGTKGTDGATIHQGTDTPPPNGTGIINDYYFNTTTKILYGPKLVDNNWTGVVETNLSGNDGLNTATVTLYAKNNTPGTAPTVPSSGSTTIDFTTGAIGSTPAGWTTTIPATGDVLWAIQQYVSANTNTDTLPNSGWSLPRILSQKGDDGDAGTIAVGTVTALSAGSTPTVTNVGTATSATFNFGIPGGAAATIAPGTATSLSFGSTPTVSNSGTSSAAIFNFGIPAGQPGYRTAVLTLYKWVNSSTAPTGTFPSGNAVYTWASASWNVTSVSLNGWSTTIGAPTKGWYLYKIDTVVSDNTSSATSTVAISGSPTVQFVSYAGADGGAIIDVSTAVQTANFSVAATDAGKLIRVNTAGSALTISVNDTTLSSMQVGSQVMFVWSAGTSGGSLTFDDTGSATLISANNMRFFRTINSFVTLIKLDATNFYLVGDLAPY